MHAYFHTDQIRFDRKIIIFLFFNFFFHFRPEYRPIHSLLTPTIEIHICNKKRIIHMTVLNLERVPIEYYLKVDLVPILGCNHNLVSF